MMMFSLILLIHHAGKMTVTYIDVLLTPVTCPHRDSQNINKYLSTPSTVYRSSLTITRSDWQSLAILYSTSHYTVILEIGLTSTLSS
jgi:hypothetical protein